MFASFFGVYKKNENGEKVSILPNLKLGMEFGKTRVITASVNNNVNKVVYDAEGNVVKQEEGVEYTEENGYKIQETPINADSAKTVDNYKRAEKTIEKIRNKMIPLRRCFRYSKNSFIFSTLIQ